MKKSLPLRLCTKKLWKPIPGYGNNNIFLFFLTYSILFLLIIYGLEKPKHQSKIKKGKRIQVALQPKESPSNKSPHYEEEEVFSSQRELKPQFSSSSERYLKLEAPQAAEWFSFFEIQLKGSLFKQNSSIYFTSSDQKWTEKDLLLDREEPFPYGEIRLGTSIIHLRLFFLEGKFKGKGTAQENITLGNHTVLAGSALESKLSFRHLFADLNVAYHYHPEELLSTTIRFSAGLGLFQIKEEISDSAGSGHVSEDALTVHYGMEGMLTLGKWLTFLGGIRGASYQDNGNKIARMSNLALFGGAKVYFSRYLYVQITYEFLHYRLNKKGKIYYLNLYGPAFAAALRF
ncbi:MAG: hypothetical protein D6785_10475 [Planctomycetota bacterium]|nr:MAG: hypothetical protein D6785_10475 [Planctomycetota bacterium]